MREIPKARTTNQGETTFQRGRGFPLTLIIVALLLALFGYDYYREVPIQRLRSRVAEVRVGDDWNTTSKTLKSFGYQTRLSGSYRDREIHNIVANQSGSYTRRAGGFVWRSIFADAGPPPAALRAPEIETNTSGTVTRVTPYLYRLSSLGQNGLVLKQISYLP